MTTLSLTIPRPTHPTGVWSWITTIDHKRIGILYGVTAFVLFLVGGVEALLMRTHLVTADQDIVSPLYEFYVTAPRIWNVTPLVDQQIGAIIIKIGGGLLFLTLLIVVFFQWFIREKQRRGAEASGEEFYGGRPEDAPHMEDISR